MLIAARMELAETYRVKARDTVKTPIEDNPAHGIRYRKTPKPVATPLPPLNLRKTEKTCPRNAINPATATAH